MTGCLQNMDGITVVLPPSTWLRQKAGRIVPALEEKLKIIFCA